MYNIYVISLYPPIDCIDTEMRRVKENASTGACVKAINFAPQLSP